MLRNLDFSQRVARKLLNILEEKKNYNVKAIYS